MGGGGGGEGGGGACSLIALLVLPIISFTFTTALFVFLFFFTTPSIIVAGIDDIRVRLQIPVSCSTVCSHTRLNVLMQCLSLGYTHVHILSATHMYTSLVLHTCTHP